MAFKCNILSQLLAFGHFIFSNLFGKSLPLTLLLFSETFSNQPEPSATHFKQKNKH